MPVLLKAQMEFVENKGQWHSNVNYKGDFKTGAFFLENKGFTVVLHQSEDIQRLSIAVHGHDDENTDNISKPINNIPPVVHSFAYKVKFLGATSNVQQIPDKKLPTHNNYFIGDDPAKWAGDCSVYTAITYSNIYPNIDIRYYSDAGKLKYDFIVKPGGNPDYIAMQYDGPKDVIIKDKELIITTPVGDVRELYPYSYQAETGKRQEIDCKYVLKNNVVTFKLGAYDRNATLIIDPSIIFSSFTGSAADNWGYTATPGPDGSFFAGGIAFGTGYRVSPGAFQGTFGGGSNEGGYGGYDVAIFKFSANGSSRMYATYLGGTGNEQPHSMIVDAQGNLIVAGRTDSDNFPNRVPGFSGAGYDIFVTKFNATGTNIISSIKIGGDGSDGVNISPKYPESLPAAISLRRNYGDDARSEVILDAANNIYLVSCTQSTNFPRRNAVQNSSMGGQDGVILKFTPNLTAILFSTYFGGSKDDACFVANISPITGDLFVAGATASANLLGITAGVIDGTFNGDDADGFITQLKSDGSAIVRTTYLGTSGIDLIYGLKFDRAGFPYVMGTTTGNWTVLNANFSNVFGGNNAKQFISKLKPDLSAYVYSTVFGTNSPVPNISPSAFLVDRCENVYVSGWGGGINVSQKYTTGTTSGMPEINPLAGIPAADSKDFYFFVLEKNANSQLFGSHFGQNGGLGDHVDGGTSRFDDNGVIYQGICANCGGGAIFPTTPGSWATTNSSTRCNQIAIKIEMNFAGVGASVQASINSVKNDTSGCVPLLVDFADTLLKGKKYYWNFGDGSPVQITATGTISHSYTVIGNYRVMLIAEDSSTCNVRDTAYVNIKVGNNRATPDFTFAKIPPCQSLTMQYTNTSTLSFGSFGPKSFVWDYGDGSPRDTGGFSPPRLHAYAAAGTYLVKLYIYDTTFCNSPDSIVKQIRLNPLVKAQFTTPALGCAAYTAIFQNTSLAGTDFLWDFGDFSTSTLVSPTHIYPLPGVYQVRLIATDTSTCNKVDTSAYYTITVVAKPVALFTWAPNPPIENTPVRFTNSSNGAIRYLWNFGDGENSTEINPSHQYNATGTYKAELIAYNSSNCSDTFRLDVRVIVLPLLDVPNAFTPAREGTNAVIRVEGFGITKMSWKIYNRWGQLVFESASKSMGWNGTFKGKLQPTDVYAYTLDVEFSDGKKLRKTGDITLLR
jgi:gliding motility-associated-like protein